VYSIKDKQNDSLLAKNNNMNEFITPGNTNDMNTPDGNIDLDEDNII
jgi:hypothetical protein